MIVLTNHYFRGSVSDKLKQYWFSRFPDFNVKRLKNPATNYTVFSGAPPAAWVDR